MNPAFFFDPRYDYGRGVPGLPRQVHGFVRDKPSRIRRALLAAPELRPADFIRPDPVRRSDLSSIHTPTVLAALQSSRAIAQAIELPALAYLPAALVEHIVLRPQRYGTGGTCAALALAAGGRWAFNLSGGYHHARPDRLHGFCLIADVAVGVHQLREAGIHRKILILDLDLHQGDGNAAAFAADPAVFTASLHEEAVFPFPKLNSDLDIGLASNLADREYLEQLDHCLTRIDQQFEPDIVVYVAGSDPYEGDPMGSLRITREGLAERDRRVARYTKQRGAALVALTAGGYSDASPELTAAGYLQMAAVQRA